MTAISDFLQSQPVVLLFIILGTGALIGPLRVAGVELGNVTGVLFVGLLAGHLGFSLPTATFNLGFILFIYCIGYQAGPQFLGAFKADGPRYAMLAVCTALVATVLAHWLATLFAFVPGTSAGLLAGALTSTPTLVAAQDALGQGAPIPEGVSTDTVLANISAAYAITYVFGLAGLVLFIALMPKLFRIDAVSEAREYAGSKGLERSVDAYRMYDLPETPTVRAYRVENKEILSMKLRERDPNVPGQVQRIKRGNEVFVPDGDYTPELGDIMSIVGLKVTHERARERVGPEVVDYDVMDRAVESRNILVANKRMVGKQLADVDIARKYQCYLTQVTRAGVRLPRRGDIALQLGDELLVTGARSRLDALTEDVGYSEEHLEKTDLVVFATGIAAGVVVGSISISVGGVSIGLGTAGGALFSGLVFGLLHSYRPTVGRFPSAARNILMELGLLLFMAGIAVRAGADIVEKFIEIGPTLAACGVVVTLAPVLTTLLLGRYLFRMNGALLLGAITGSMTSTAALTQVNNQARSTVPMLGYVGTYAFANILLAIAGAIIIRL